MRDSLPSTRKAGVARAAAGRSIPPSFRPPFKCPTRQQPLVVVVEHHHQDDDRSASERVPTERKVLVDDKISEPRLVDTTATSNDITTNTSISNATSTTTSGASRVPPPRSFLRPRRSPASPFGGVTTQFVPTKTCSSSPPVSLSCEAGKSSSSTALVESFQARLHHLLRPIPRRATFSKSLGGGLRHLMRPIPRKSRSLGRPIAAVATSTQAARQESSPTGTPPSRPATRIASQKEVQDDILLLTPSPVIRHLRVLDQEDIPCAPAPPDIPVGSSEAYNTMTKCLALPSRLFLPNDL